MHFDRTSEAFQKAARMARRVGMRFHVGHNPMFVRGKGHGVEDIDDLTHELGHFLVSPARLRHRAYYGLGLTAFGLDKPKPAVHEDVILALEQEASLLGLALYYHFTGCRPGAKLVAFQHGWYNSGLMQGQSPMTSIDYTETFARLESKGLMTPPRRSALVQVFS